MGIHPRVHVNAAMGFPLGHGVPTEGIYSSALKFVLELDAWVRVSKLWDFH
jgi:hypothetical protein